MAVHWILKHLLLVTTLILLIIAIATQQWLKIEFSDVKRDIDVGLFRQCLKDSTTKESRCFSFAKEYSSAANVKDIKRPDKSLLTRVTLDRIAELYDRTREALTASQTISIFSLVFLVLGVATMGYYQYSRWAASDLIEYRARPQRNIWYTVSTGFTLFSGILFFITVIMATTRVQPDMKDFFSVYDRIENVGIVESTTIDGKIQYDVSFSFGKDHIVDTKIGYSMIIAIFVLLMLAASSIFIIVLRASEEVEEEEPAPPKSSYPTFGTSAIPPMREQTRPTYSTAGVTTIAPSSQIHPAAVSTQTSISGEVAAPKEVA